MLAVFVITLLGGLAVRYGLHRFVSAVLLNIWFVIALSVQAGYHLDHTQASAWAQALAWLIGSALTLAYVTVLWLARDRTAQPQPAADFIPGSTKPVPLTKPVIMFAVIRARRRDGCGHDRLRAAPAERRLDARLRHRRHETQPAGLRAGRRVPAGRQHQNGARSGDRRAGRARRGHPDRQNYAWYCAAVAGAVLIGLDLPHPSSLADEGRRILFTFIGGGIAVLVMFLASQLAKRTPGATQTKPAAPAGAAG